MSEIKQIDPADWKQFLEEFSTRNNNRRARLAVYRSGGAVENESSEQHLEDVHIESEGENHTIEIVRIDRSKQNAEKMHDKITNVRGVAVQYDTDGSEDALEITDNQNTLVSVRMESRVDGAS